jgi:hypothetical protein
MAVLIVGTASTWNTPSSTIKILESGLTDVFEYFALGKCVQVRQPAVHKLDQLGNRSTEKRLRWTKLAEEKNGPFCSLSKGVAFNGLM